MGATLVEIAEGFIEVVRQEAREGYDRADECRVRDAAEKAWLAATQAVDHAMGLHGRTPEPGPGAHGDRHEFLESIGRRDLSERLGYFADRLHAGCFDPGDARPGTSWTRSSTRPLSSSRRPGAASKLVGAAMIEYAVRGPPNELQEGRPAGIRTRLASFTHARRPDLPADAARELFDESRERVEGPHEPICSSRGSGLPLSTVRLLSRLQTRDEHAMAVPFEGEEESIIPEPDPVGLARQARELLHVEAGTCANGILREEVEGGQELPPCVGGHPAEVLFNPPIDEDLERA